MYFLGNSFTKLYGSKTLLVVVAIFSLKICEILLGHVLLRRYAPDPHIVPSAFPSNAQRNVRTFIENTVHFGVKGDEDEWDAMVPNDGIVFLGIDKRPFTISMFHQLRCLNIIRQGVVDLEARLSADPSSTTTSLNALTHHCVNYLRQMVLCRSDLDLDTVFGNPKPAVYSDSYQCKDWDMIYKDVEENQAKFGYYHAVL